MYFLTGVAAAYSQPVHDDTNAPRVALLGVVLLVKNLGRCWWRWGRGDNINEENTFHNGQMFMASVRVTWGNVIVCVITLGLTQSHLRPCKRLLKASHNFMLLQLAAVERSSYLAAINLVNPLIFIHTQIPHSMQLIEYQHANILKPSIQRILKWSHNEQAASDGWRHPTKAGTYP